MKKFITWLLILALFTAPCGQRCARAEIIAGNDAFAYSITGLSDPRLLPYMEDTIYAGLVAELSGEGYFIENVEVVYISQEYLDEVAYNSRSNIFFGYTLAELDAQFTDSKYVFTLGEDGSTVVQPFQDYDDTYDRVLQNVAIGTGVILICVTVSVVSGGVGAPAVSVVFAAAAKSGTVMALSGGAFSATAAGLITYVQTGDIDATVAAATLSGSESFKWGAITGAVNGGASQYFALKGATLNGLTMNEVAMIQRETGWPAVAIKSLHSMAEYRIYRNANLRPIRMADGSWAFIRSIDWNLVDGDGVTNLARICAGKPPIDATGASYELHHIGMRADAPLAILSRAEHHNRETYTILHYASTGKDISSSMWDKQRAQFWMSMWEYITVGY